MSLTTATNLADCFQLRLPMHPDQRGCLVKSFHAPMFAAHQICANFQEDFFSVSHKNVLRGFHVVTPPVHGAKLVYVIHGQIMDALLDLRPSSPTYGVSQLFELSASRGDALYLSAGIGHAFLATSDTAIVGYKTEFPHDPAHDHGVRWDSTPVKWPVENPIISVRDQALPPLDQFENPFA